MASDTTEEGVMYIRLGPYLEELALVEKAKPEGQCRLVPTMRDIAENWGSGNGTV